jgi:translocation and assembly module TamA
MRNFRIALIIFLSPLFLFASVPYTVDFEGVEDSHLLKAIRTSSQLSSLKNRPPSSVNALRYRAESDLPEILKVLQAYGYYEATATMRLREEADITHVIISIHPGPLYRLTSYVLNIYSGEKSNTVKCLEIDLNTIGIHLGKAALAEPILDAELKLLFLLSECGYPLAEIVQREIIADGEKKTVRIDLEIQAGAPACFGNLTIEGLNLVNPRLIYQKMAWRQGERYNSSLVEITQKTLFDTGLFSSVLIAHGQEVNEKGELPMTIQVAESRYRSVNAGVSYQTFWGPGITLGWENRNIDGMGRRLSIQGEATRISHSGVATYFVSDYRRIGQDYIWQAQALHEDIRAYHERSYNLINRLERKIGKKMRISAGAELEKLYVTSSVDNGIFFLFELPLYFRWSNANSLLNPTEGMTFEYLTVPTLSLKNPRDNYLSQTLTFSYYLPLTSDHVISVAQKFTFGSILSEKLDFVPTPKRFLGGTGEDLRGYHFKTVSPLADHHKPIGGRSALYYSLETRFRVSKTVGLVPFFDFGSVWLEQFPAFHGKWFKSLGLGLRYFSFIGPIRFDIAFPLDRRKDLDKVLQIFVSIGQMF